MSVTVMTTTVTDNTYCGRARFVLDALPAHVRSVVDGFDHADWLDLETAIEAASNAGASSTEIMTIKAAYAIYRADTAMVDLFALPEEVLGRFLIALQSHRGKRPIHLGQGYVLDLGVRKD